MDGRQQEEEAAAVGAAQLSAVLLQRAPQPTRSKDLAPRAKSVLNLGFPMA